MWSSFRPERERVCVCVCVFICVIVSMFGVSVTERQELKFEVCERN